MRLYEALPFIPQINDLICTASTDLGGLTADKLWRTLLGPYENFVHHGPQVRPARWSICAPAAPWP